MLSSLSESLYARARGRYVLFSFGALVLFIRISLPLLGVIFPSGKSLTSLDDPAFHSAAEVISIIDGWSEAGRHINSGFT